MIDSARNTAVADVVANGAHVCPPPANSAACVQRGVDLQLWRCPDPPATAFRLSALHDGLVGMLLTGLPGLTLNTNRPEIAASILRTYAQYIDQGMIPNRFPDMGEKPEYNTVDATLWYIEAIRAYRTETGALVCFTLDAGANVHMLFAPVDENRIVNNLLPSLLLHCQDKQYLCTALDRGPEKLGL